MGNEGDVGQTQKSVLIPYLHSWGLREFQDEDSYFQWQRSRIPQEELQKLQELLEHRYGGDKEADIQFYDFLARPTLLPIVYSERFDYYVTIGSILSKRILPAQRVLDFGCGVGILTSFYAQQFPELEFVGIDRSRPSIEVARKEARKRHLRNIHFKAFSEPDDSIGGRYDLILSTQALFQSERDPGLPSQSWRTFHRQRDRACHEELEVRTGLYTRLNELLTVLSPVGRMILFEKSWHLGRRVLLQRALENRGLFPVVEAIPCAYHSLGQTLVDGPLYEVAPLSAPGPIRWKEEPYCEPGETLYRSMGAVAEGMGKELLAGKVEHIFRGKHPTLGDWFFRFGVWNQALVWCWCEASDGFHGLVLGGKIDTELLFQMMEKLPGISDEDFEAVLQGFWGPVPKSPQDDLTPGYENHQPSAQAIYEDLPLKVIQQESTFQDTGGREMHLEVGKTKGFVYFYWANTFDQRQLVLVEGGRAPILYQYYQESYAQALPPAS